MREENFVRFVHAFTGVLVRQQSDSLCSQCRAFTNSLNNLFEAIAEFKKTYPEIPATLATSLEQALRQLHSLKPPVDAPGQKKAGNCKMPHGVCFIKTPKKILELI